MNQDCIPIMEESDMNLTELLIRITAGFIVLFILARVMGRKEISQDIFQFCFCNCNWLNNRQYGS